MSSRREKLHDDDDVYSAQRQKQIKQYLGLYSETVADS